MIRKLQAWSNGLTPALQCSLALYLCPRNVRIVRAAIMQALFKIANGHHNFKHQWLKRSRDLQHLAYILVIFYSVITLRWRGQQLAKHEYYKDDLVYEMFFFSAWRKMF